jgi:hypothetical protein
MDGMNLYGYDAFSNIQKQLEQMRGTNFGQPSTNIVWVQGPEGAKGHPVPNKANVLMLDSENENTMYIVSSDEVGMRKMRTFKFEEIEAKPPETAQYCTKDDVRSIILEMMSKKEVANDAVIS